MASYYPGTNIPRKDRGPRRDGGLIFEPGGKSGPAIGGKGAEESPYGEDKPCICPKEPKSPEQNQPPPQQPGSGQPEEPQDSYDSCPLCNGTTPPPKPPYYYEQPDEYIPTMPDSET